MSQEELNTRADLERQVSKRLQQLLSDSDEPIEQETDASQFADPATLFGG